MAKAPLDIALALEGLSSTDWKLRAEAAQTLGKSRNPAAVEPLSQALANDTSFTVRSRAAVSLGKLKDVRAAEPLILAMEAGNWQLLKHAFAAILKLGPAAVPALERFATDHKQRASLRAKCLELLGQIGTEAAIAPLLQNITDPDFSVRLQAIHSLGEFKNERVFKALLHALQTFSIPVAMRPGVKHSLRPVLEQALVQALSNSQDERIVQPFLALLEGKEAYGPDTEVLLAVTNGFRRMSDVRGKTFADLVAATEYANPIARIAAALSLCWLRDRRGVEPLRKLTEDDAPKVQSAARWALPALETSLSFNVPVFATVTDSMLR